MTHSWILDVLDDLKSFAALNDLPVLAGQLGDAAIVAEAELASKRPNRKMGAIKVRPNVQTRYLSGSAGPS